MHPDIERIVRCDESGRAIVENAKRKADDIIRSAKEAAETEKLLVNRDLEAFRERELMKILDEARDKATKKRKEAEDYIKKLRARSLEKSSEIDRKFLDIVFESLS